jgi:hypothetical protein
MHVQELSLDDIGSNMLKNLNDSMSELSTKGKAVRKYFSNGKQVILRFRKDGTTINVQKEMFTDGHFAGEKRFSIPLFK